VLEAPATPTNVVNDAVKAYQRDLCRRNFRYLCEQILDTEIFTFQLPWLKMHVNTPRSIEVAFRGSRKSQVLTICYTVYKIIRDNDTRCLLWSQVSSLASHFATQVKTIFEENRKFRDLFGDWVGYPWNNNEFTVRTRLNKRLREPTVMTAGVGTSLTGNHFDVITADDAEDEKSVKSPARRTATSDFFWTTVYPARVLGRHPPTEFHNVGVFLHPRAFLETLMKNPEYAGNISVIPAMDPTETKSVAEEFVSTEELLKTREGMPERPWKTQFMCSHNYNDRTYPEHFFIGTGFSEIPQLDRVAVGVDWAAAMSSDAAHFSVTTAGIRRLDNKKIFVLDSVKTKCSLREKFDIIATQIDQWKPQVVVMEGNAVQSLMKEAFALYLELLGLLGISNGMLDEKKIKLIYTQQDKVTRAENLQPKFRAGGFKFRSGFCDELIADLMEMPYEGFDSFDSWEFAVRELDPSHIGGFKLERWARNKDVHERGKT